MDINVLCRIEPRVIAYEDSIEKGVFSKIKRILLLRHKIFLYLFTKYINNSYEIFSPMYYGMKLCLPLVDSNARFLYFFGTLSHEEYPLTRYLALNLHPDDVFYDVGANFGFYTFLAASIIKQNGEVHSFEPNPLCFSSLEKTKDHNDLTQVILNNVGLYSSNGSKTFYGREVSFYNGSAGYSLKSDVSPDKKYFSIFEIKTKTLDTYVNEKKVPTVIKIDVEGGEADVIDGAREVLLKYKPTIIMEVWNDNQGSPHSRNAVQKMFELGYVAFAIDEQGRTDSIGRDAIFSFESSIKNYIFKYGK